MKKKHITLKLRVDREKPVLQTETMFIITDLKMVHDTVPLAFYLT